jgi:hypothetical protein
VVIADDGFTNRGSATDTPVIPVPPPVPNARLFDKTTPVPATV